MISYRLLTKIARRQFARKFTNQRNLPNIIGQLPTY